MSNKNTGRACANAGPPIRCEQQQKRRNPVRKLSQFAIAAALLTTPVAAAQESPHYAVKTCDQGDCHLSGEYFGLWACRQAAARALKSDQSHGRNPTTDCVMAQ
jgi:hypothetical protein